MLVLVKDGRGVLYGSGGWLWDSRRLLGDRGVDVGVMYLGRRIVVVLLF